MRLRCIPAVMATWLLAVVPAAAQDRGAYPSAAEVKELLQREPITEASWPAWKERLTSWFGDRTRQTDEAYRAAERFARSQANAAGELPQKYTRDYLAWYFLGGSYMLDTSYGPRDPGRAEMAYRWCTLVAPKFARGHRNLAWAISERVQASRGSEARPADVGALQVAQGELDKARLLDPDLPLSGVEAVIALRAGRYDTAERLLDAELRAHPEDVGTASLLAQAVLMNPAAQKRSAARIGPLVERFPAHSPLAALHALALADDGRTREAYHELARARTLDGPPPEEVLGPTLVRQIEEAGRPGYLEQFLWVMLYFAAAYAAIMLLMAGAGVVLAMLTRGTAALELLRKQSPDALVAEGQVARVQRETLLARLYGLALVAGLVLFYAAIPFVIAGMLGLTALLVYLIFLGGRIPIKLVAIIVVVGGVGAWSVFKSLFARPASGAFGLPKSAADCPRIHELLGEVARRVDTDPVDEVFIAPGSAVGVHQEGRGPFGVFGVKRRVLTLGLSTVRFLSVGELKAILAHEYAHFSHKDTFYGRFIYQVHLSIESALWGMRSSGGTISYVNPFYWFLWLYYKSYSLLAAGYSRSREFLADRMAATLYGADQFTRALTKVCTDGTLFEMTVYDHISQLLAEQKAFINMYQAFQEYRDEQIPREEREQLYQKLLAERGSLFASHPTFAERIEAVRALAPAAAPDDRPALELFEQPEAVEKEMTQFLTDYLAFLQHLRTQAAAQQA